LCPKRLRGEEDERKEDEGRAKRPHQTPTTIPAWIAKAGLGAKKSSAEIKKADPETKRDGAETKKTVVDAKKAVKRPKMARRWFQPCPRCVDLLAVATVTVVAWYTTTRSMTDSFSPLAEASWKCLI
jgi:hypothetical protein